MAIPTKDYEECRGRKNKPHGHKQLLTANPPVSTVEDNTGESTGHAAREALVRSWNPSEWSHTNASQEKSMSAWPMTEVTG